MKTSLMKKSRQVGTRVFLCVWKIQTRTTAAFGYFQNSKNFQDDVLHYKITEFCHVIFRLLVLSIFLISPGPSLHRGDGEEEMDQGVLPGDEEDTPPPVPPELITRVARCLEELKKCIKEAPHTTVSLLNREKER